jgi:hypothetical protein
MDDIFAQFIGGFFTVMLIPVAGLAVVGVSMIPWEVWVGLAGIAVAAVVPLSILISGVWMLDYLSPEGRRRRQHQAWVKDVEEQIKIKRAQTDQTK